MSQEKFNVWVNGNLSYLEYLFDRWNEEKQYEDFKDYKKEVVKRLSEGMTLFRMIKKPFEVVVEIDNKKYGIRINKKDVKTFTLE